jgi:hypothetical protein
MYWAIVATVLWFGLAAGLGLGIWGLTSRQPAIALAAGAVGTAVIIVFSWLAALSIGPFTIALAVALTALVATRGLASWARIAALAVGLAIYYVVVWAVPPVQPASLIVIPGMCFLTYAAAVFVRIRQSTVHRTA